LFGALGERLRAWTGGGGAEPQHEPEPTTAQRLDDALARLRDRVPAEEDKDDPGGETDARGGEDRD
jgi:hypothetical protein